MSSNHALEGMCEGPELSTVIAFCACNSFFEGSDEKAATNLHAAHQNQSDPRSQEIAA